MSATKENGSFMASPGKDTDVSDYNCSPDKVKVSGKILIEGNIGSGKTTVLTAIEAPFYIKKFELVDKYADILKQFYENPKQYAFALQKRIAEINLEIEDEVDRPAVFERSLESGIYIFSDMLNKDGLIEDHEMEQLRYFLNYSIPIAAFIYIDVDIDTCLERIKIRGRPGEEHITKDYLQRLRGNMDLMYEKYERTGIPCTKIKNPTGCLEETARQIDEFISQIIIR